MYVLYRSKGKKPANSQHTYSDLFVDLSSLASKPDDCCMLFFLKTTKTDAAGRKQKKREKEGEDIEMHAAKGKVGTKININSPCFLGGAFDAACSALFEGFCFAVFFSSSIFSQLEDMAIINTAQKFGHGGGD
jgi:hypothetical protein